MKEAFWIIDQLVKQGVKRFCIAPGSRNTPLIIAAAEHPEAETMVHFDERGIGFYALGFAKGANRAAAVIATSGTAAGNLLPAVMEAHHSRTPMILLTADRPAELRDCGANQTSDQVKLFSAFVRWQADLPPELNEAYFRSIAAQGAFHAACNPPGPVQLNCQFREPLYTPSPPILSGSPITPHFFEAVPKPITVEAMRGIILIGSIPSSPQPILDLAKRLQWPVFADILSQARTIPSYEQIRYFDWVLPKAPELRPDYVLHFGDRLVSKSVLPRSVDLHVSPFPFLQDPLRSLSSRVQSDILPFCERFDARTDPSWLASWKQRDATIESSLEKMFALDSPFTEAHAMRRLGKMLPSNTAVFLGNGMPIRDGDHFLFPNACRGFFGNRGLSGIDGNIATAAGLAEGLACPVAAFIGDQACLHDLSSLPLLTKGKYPVTLLVSNNFGGGIFSRLPVAKWSKFETFMAAAHPWRFAEAAAMFSIPYLSLEQISFDTPALVELITSRNENHRFEKELELPFHHPMKSLCCQFKD